MCSRSLEEIIIFLRQAVPVLQKKKILAGFDGFVDTIVKPVREFNAGSEHEFFHSIDEFGRFIAEHSHKSTSIQYETIERKPGGNMPIFAKALSALSLFPAAVGMLSAETGDIDPLFKELGKNCCSYLTAGNATVLEFDDGKIFLSPVNTGGLNKKERAFPRIIAAFPGFGKAVADADFTAFLNWSELLFAQDLWSDIYAYCLDSAETDKNRIAFFDLCDTAAKNLPEIEALLSTVKKIGGRRKTILSLNKNEALDIGGKINGKESAMEETAELLFRYFALDELVIHQHTESIAVSSAEGLVRAPCVFNNNPKISTGAGDHFNAAYCITSLAGLPLAEKLVFANACSGVYITAGFSPRLEDIAVFFKKPQ